jgi:xylulokinase
MVRQLRIKTEPMRTLVIGVDSGTQSTKALVVNAATGKVLGEGSKSYGLIDGLAPGAKEQDPATWIDSTSVAIRKALKQAKAKPSEVRALGVSGQQHGFVPLDKKGAVIRAAKLWCDTSTEAECVQMTERLGGLKQSIKLVGNAILPGFTAPKILWLKNKEPKNYKRLATVLLPHDYLNYWLTGRAVMECGDASGTALLDVKKRVWQAEAISAIDGALSKKLPDLIQSDEPAGSLQSDVASALGLTSEVLVSAGGGDNMMGAIGTGNTDPGVITASFGTSGTIYACAGKPVIDPAGEIAAFCDSTNRWLPLLCTMNVTVATELIRKHYGWTHDQFEKAARRVSPGSDGLVLLPYLEGERTPNVPDGTGVWLGVNQRTTSPGHFARAAMEGVTMGMNYGLSRLAKLGVKPTQIRATGGGANSKLWRQIMADVFNAEVVTLQVGEGAAYGAALQALWSWQRREGDDISITDITRQFVKVNGRQRALPNAKTVAHYQRTQALQDSASKALRKVFSQHRSLIAS